MTLDVSNFYGDNTRWFVGVVINHVDPENRGRVQVRVHGVHGDDLTAVPDHTLPWAETMLPSTEGGVSGIGKIPQILSSAQVFGIFLDGVKSQHPLVLGSLTHNENPTATQKVLAGGRGDSLRYSSQAVGTDGTVVNPTTRTAWDTSTSRERKRSVIMKFFIENGLTPIQAAGITGNLEAESGLSPTPPVGGVGEQGIAQWNPKVGRLQNLQAYAARTNQDWQNVFVQLSFILHEFRGRPVNNDGGSSYASVYNRLLNCTTFEGGVGGNRDYNEYFAT